VFFHLSQVTKYWRPFPRVITAIRRRLRFSVPSTEPFHTAPVFFLHLPVALQAVINGVAGPETFLSFRRLLSPIFSKLFAQITLLARACYLVIFIRFCGGCL
jgi:hypothetical protein